MNYHKVLHAIYNFVFSPRTLDPWLGPSGRGQSGVLWFPLSLMCRWPLNGSFSRPAINRPPWNTPSHWANSVCGSTISSHILCLCDTDLDGDVHRVYHHSSMSGANISSWRVACSIQDLQDPDDCQLVERRSAAVQNHPRTCKTEASSNDSTLPLELHQAESGRRVTFHLKDKEIHDWNKQTVCFPRHYLMGLPHQHHLLVQWSYFQLNFPSKRH